MKVLRRVPYLREIALLARRFADAVLEDEDAAFDPTEPAVETSPEVPPEKPAPGKGPPAHWLADIAAKAPHLVHDGEITGGALTSFDLRAPTEPEDKVEPSRPFIAPKPPTKQPPQTQATAAKKPAPPNDILNVNDHVVQQQTAQRQTAQRQTAQRQTAQRQTVQRQTQAPAANKPAATLRAAEKPTAAQTAPARHDSAPTNIRATTTFVPRIQSPASPTTPAPALEHKTPSVATHPPQPKPSSQISTNAPTVWPDIPPQIHAATPWPTIEDASPAEQKHASAPVQYARPEKPHDVARPRPQSLKAPLDPIPTRPPAESPRDKTSFVEVPRERQTSTAWPKATTNLTPPERAPLPNSAESPKFYETNDPWPALEPGDNMTETAPHVITLELQASRAARLDKEQRGDW